MNVTLNYTAAELPHVLNKISGKNFLDNSNLTVNQRQGKIVVIGKTYYSNSGLTTSAGVTAKYHTLQQVSAGVYEFYGDGVDGTLGTWYYVSLADSNDGYLGTGYSLDRWYVGAGGLAVIVYDDHVTLRNVGEATGTFYQTVENWPDMVGDKYTISLILADRTMVSRNATIATTMDTQFPLYSGGTEIGHLDFYTPSANVGTYRIALYAGYSIDVKRCKLEHGKISTLANDPPADYGEELIKCKRFYRLWTTEAARTEALKEVGLMRLASPTLGTIVIGGVTYYYASADL